MSDENRTVVGHLRMLAEQARAEGDINRAMQLEERADLAQARKEALAATRAESIRPPTMNGVKMLGQLRREGRGPQGLGVLLASNGAAHVPGPYIDWPAFWSRDREEPEWVFEPILARRRAHAIYASHKTGKSLLLLWIAAQLATLEQMVVIYLDFEMTEDDIYERLDEMGYGPDSDLSLLRYALLPSLPPLDTAAGGAALHELVDQAQADHPGLHVVVLIDTTGRAVAGAENDSDTFRDFFRHTGLGLKQRGVTYARTDHAGKDPTRGQRGSSGKGDDVDVIWSITAVDDGLNLKRDAARMNWIPEGVALGRPVDPPLRFAIVNQLWPPGTTYTATLLDELGIDRTWGERKAGKAMRDEGHTVSNSLVRAAQKYRRQSVVDAA